jgi:hypothetical protein
LNIAGENGFRASAAIVIPAPAVPNLKAHIAHENTMAGVCLAIVGMTGRVNSNSDYQGFNCH